VTSVQPASIDFPPPSEFVARAITFGLLVVAGIAGIVLAGAWWTACIAAAGLLVAAAGLVISIVALLSDEQARSWQASRLAALVLAALSIAAIVVAIAA
jgi:hypothetical protein